jgi:hypothetical protein
MTIDLNSSVKQVGPLVTQIIGFTNGSKKTFTNIISNTITQSEFTSMMTSAGYMIKIATDKVLWVEVHPQ